MTLCTRLFVICIGVRTQVLTIAWQPRPYLQKCLKTQPLRPASGRLAFRGLGKNDPISVRYKFDLLHNPAPVSWDGKFLVWSLPGFMPPQLKRKQTNLILSCNLTFFTMAQKELSDNSLKRPESTWATNSSPLPKFCTGYKFHSNNQQKVNIEILWISMNRVCKNSFFYIYI